MREFAGMAHLSVWYSRLDAETVQRWRSEASRKQITRTQAIAAKAKSKDNLRAVAKLTVPTGRAAAVRIGPAPPRAGGGADRGSRGRHGLGPRRGARPLRREPCAPNCAVCSTPTTWSTWPGRWSGVGSVGTRAWIILLEGQETAATPLILQAKEAQASVLEAHVGASEFPHHGERVVVGQRLMQSSSDIFLGWVTATGIDGQERDFYVRQLWDWKGSVDLDAILPDSLRVYGELCSWTLARAHARSGDAVAIASYLGSGDQFDRALVRFAGVLRRPKRLGPRRPGPGSA